MKITLEYLVDDDHNELDEAITHLKSNDVRSFLWRFEQVLRGYNKHGVPDEYDTVDKVVDHLWSTWHELKSDFEIGDD